MEEFHDAPAPPSPVTWHIAFWTLACLCVSCMSQPRKRFCAATGRSRIYYVCSPILCATDTISVLVRLVVALYCTGGDIETAAQFAQSRTVNPEANEDTANPRASQEDRQLDEEATSHSMNWPRILLFIIGTLPAAIKLAAFGGVPWTKAWGMMFVANFISTEVVSLLSHRHNATYPEKVTTSQQEQDTQQDPSHESTQLAQLGSKLNTLDTTLIVCASLAHVGLFFYMGSVLWMKVLKTIWSSTSVFSINSVLPYLKGLFHTILLFYAGFSILICSLRSHSRADLSGMWQNFVIGLVATVLVPEMPKNVVINYPKEEVQSLYKPPSWIKGIGNTWSTPQARVARPIVGLVKVALCFSLFFGIALSIMLYVFGRLPGIKLWRVLRRIFLGLLLTVNLLPEFPDVLSPSKEEVLLASVRSWTPSLWLRSRQLAIAWIYFAVVFILFNMVLLTVCKRWPRVAVFLLIEPKKQEDKTEETTETEEATEVAEATDQDMLSKESVVNLDACWALFFFMSSLVVCVLWYAFKYDPDGTTNPAWTDVFG